MEHEQDLIGYSQLIDSAMRQVVREALRIVQRDGFPGTHHCYVTFRTGFPGVEMADSLREQYPEEMTIVLQHQFWDLDVREDGFTVALSFNQKREPLIIPFAAITAYADPSIKFGLQFRRVEDMLKPAATKPAAKSKGKSATSGKPKKPTGPAEVISLDTFRKKDS
jgi:hypothetical protein